MNLKCFLAFTVSLICSPIYASSIFPVFIDNGPYDSVQNELEFSVSGFFNDADSDNNFNTGDSIQLLFKPILNSGGLDTANFAYVFAAQAGSVLGGSTYNLDPISGGLGSLLGNVSGGPISSNSLFAAIGSETIDLSGATFVSDVNVAGVAYEFTGGAATATDDLALASGTENFVSGNTDFSLTFLGSVFDNFLTTNTDFLPIVNGTRVSDITFATDGLNSKVFAAAPSGNVDSAGRILGSVNPIPEPASLLTLLGCVAGVGAMGRRRRKAVVAA